MSTVNLDTVLHGSPADVKWLVPGMLPRDTMMILAGDPGVGKSFLCYSLAVALAAGGRFLGRVVEQARVLYFDEENSRPDHEQYLRWAWHGMSQPDIPTLQEHLRIEHFSLVGLSHQPYDAMRLMVGEHRPDLIIIDTATPICRIKDENSNAEASQAVRALRGIKPDGACCLIIKHAKTNDIRGAKAWKGECDGLILHTCQVGRPPRDGLRTTYLKPGKVRAFGLRDELSVQPERVGEGIALSCAEWAHEDRKIARFPAPVAPPPDAN